MTKKEVSAEFPYNLGTTKCMDGRAYLPQMTAMRTSCRLFAEIGSLDRYIMMPHMAKLAELVVRIRRSRELAGVTKDMLQDRIQVAKAEGKHMNQDTATRAILWDMIRAAGVTQEDIDERVAKAKTVAGELGADLVMRAFVKESSDGRIIHLLDAIDADWERRELYRLAFRAT